MKNSVKSSIFVFVMVFAICCCQQGRQLPNPDQCKFSDLPSQVRYAFSYRDSVVEFALYNQLVFSLDTNKIYQFEVERTGPWTDYFKLFDIDNDVSYLIPKKPFPYVLLNNKLYIPVNRNISNPEDAMDSQYECYELRR